MLTICFNCFFQCHNIFLLAFVSCTSKAELHQKKIMLSAWWYWKGVVFFEPLPRNQTINSDVYCRQMNKLNAAVKEIRPELVNRKGVLLHHDNATPHTCLATRQKLLKLGWVMISKIDYIKFK